MYHQIHELSLNHNHIEKLDGIESFKQLQHLSLNFNCISSYDELKKITKELRELELKQNPKLSIDKDRLMSMFPNLEKLNGVIIRQKEITNVDTIIVK